MDWAIMVKRSGGRLAPAVSRRKLHWRWPVTIAAAIIVAALLIVRNCNQAALNNQSAPVGQQILNGSVPAGTVIYPELDRYHVPGKVLYDHSPPVGGNHAPVWLSCGIYDYPVANENAVHSLEHGSVWVTYLPVLPQAEVDDLRALVKASYQGTERYVILSPYPAQSAPVVVSAWGYQLTLQDPTDPRLKSFINYFRHGPQTLEPSAHCTGGTGNPIS
jgi:uncharacterized protein DUF3105